MKKLIDFDSYPVRTTLQILLKDKTTKNNIIWATDAYAERGHGFQDKNHIDVMAIKGLDSIDLQSRTEKAMEEQQERTRKKAEVFTPVWLCNKMNNYADEQWFGKLNVFTYELMHETGFPALRIGSRIVVPKEKFCRWVDAQTGGDA